MNKLKQILISAVLICFALNASAQATLKDDITFNIGASFGTYGYYGSGLGFMVPVIVSGEYSVHDYASVGAYFGYATRLGASSIGRYHYFATGVRGSFHYWQLIEDKTDAPLRSDILDFYVTLNLGYELINYVGSDVGGNIGVNNRVFYGGLLGFRVYPTDWLGFFLEAGGGVLGFSTFGVTLRMRKETALGF